LWDDTTPLNAARKGHAKGRGDWGEGGGGAFKYNVRDSARAAEALHLDWFAEEGEEGGVEVDFADEGEQSLRGSTDDGGYFEAVNRWVALGAVPYLKGGCDVWRMRLS
jgi:hypothetical protein